MKKRKSGLGRFFVTGGAGAVEYGLLVAMISVAIIVSVQFIGVKLENVFSQVCYRINSNSPC